MMKFTVKAETGKSFEVLESVVRENFPTGEMVFNSAVITLPEDNKAAVGKIDDIFKHNGLTILEKTDDGKLRVCLRSERDEIVYGL